MEIIPLLLYAALLGVLLQGLSSTWMLAKARSKQIEEIQNAHGTRVITMIHRQDTRRFGGIPVSTMINIEDAQTIIEAIQSTPDDRPIDLVLHTPGGMVLAAMQIARAVKAHKGKVTVYVPIYAMSGGTLIALAADEIVLGTYSVLGPVDPQFGALPAASMVAARDAKSSRDEVGDLTLLLADMGEKAIHQVRSGVVEILEDRVGREKAEEMADRMATGTWTHDYGITLREAGEIGMPVREGIPDDVLKLMTLYPQPARSRSSVEYVIPDGDKKQWMF